MLTLPSVLTKQCGVVAAMVDRWHHLVLLSLVVLVTLKLRPLLIWRDKCKVNWPPWQPCQFDPVTVAVFLGCSLPVE